MAVFNSLSSSLILGTTLYRNQPGILNKVKAAPAYALCAVVAAVETVAAIAFAAITLYWNLFGIDISIYEAFNWVGSSAFCVAWATANLFLNLFTDRLVADEISARRILHSGNLLMIPEGAII